MSFANRATAAQSLRLLALFLSAIALACENEPSRLLFGPERSRDSLTPIVQPASSGGNGAAIKIVCQGLAGGNCTATGTGGAINNLTDALNTLNAPLAPNPAPTTPAVFSWVNNQPIDWTDGNGTKGLFAVDLDSTKPFGGEVHQVPWSFAGYIAIPASNTTTVKSFAIGSDDGFKFAITDGTSTFLYQAGIRSFTYGGTPTGTGTLAQLVVTFPASPSSGQLYAFDLVYFDQAGQQGLEFAWADGNKALPAAGALNGYTLVPAASLYAPDIRAAMWVDNLTNATANVAAGTNLRYTALIKNQGLVAAANLGFSVKLPTANFSGLASTTTGCTVATAGGVATLTCVGLPTLAANGGSTQVQFTATATGTGSNLDVQGVVTGLATAPEVAAQVGDTAQIFVLTDDPNASDPLITGVDTGNGPSSSVGSSRGLVDDDATRVTIGKPVPQPATVTAPSAPQVDDKPVTISGTSNFVLGSQVLVTVVGSSATCLANAAANGTWSCALSLNDGNYTLNAALQNGGGAVGAPSANFAITLTPPPAPVLTSPASNAYFKSSTVFMAGTSTEPAGTQVRVTSTDAGSTQRSCIAVVQSDTTFGCPQTVPDGTYAWTAGVVEPGGGVGTTPAPMGFTVNTQALTAPGLNQTTSPTNNNKPTLTGTAPLAELGAGYKLEIRENGVVLCTVNPISATPWTCPLTSALADGSHGLVADIVDPGGNISPSSSPDVFSVDTHTPATPVVNAVASPTSNNKPSFSGSAEAGSTVTVKNAGGAVLCTTTTLANLTWSCTSTVVLPDGSNTISAFATDPAGTTGAAGTTTFTVDTHTPGSPAITAPVSGTLSKNSAPALSGSGETGDTLVVKDQTGRVLCTVTVAASAWSCTSAALPDGTTTLTAVQTDPAGASSTSSAAITYKVDTIAPAAPDLAQTQSPGSNTLPTFTGNAEPGSTVRVSEGATLLCTASASAGGSYSCTSTVALSSPVVHNVTATATDAALNTSGNSNTDTFTVDTTVPAAPTLAAQPTPTGGQPGQGANAQPSFSGTGTPGDVVAVKASAPAAVAGQTLCTAVVKADNTWNCQDAIVLTGSPATTYTFAATQTSPAGVTSPATAAQTLTVDTHMPSAPTLAQPATPAKNPLVALTGTAEPGDSLVVKSASGAIVCSVAQVAVGGGWSCTTSALPDGSNTLTAVSTSPAGVVSPASASVAVVVDTVAPVAPALAQTFSPTSNTTPTFSGAAEAGSTVKVSEGATLLCSTVALGNSTFSCTSTVVLTGTPQTHNATATSTDAAGNTGPASNTDTFVVDTRTPAAPTLAALPASTANTQPTFSGSGVFGDVVTVKASAPAAVAGQTLCAATVASDGSWSCASGIILTGSPATTYTVAATQTSPAGVPSAASASQSFLDDTHTPATPTLAALASPISNKTPTLSGTGEVGSIVTVKDQTGRVLCTVTVPAGGTWSCTSAALPDGTTTLTASAASASGIAATGTATQAITVDTVAPAAPALAQTGSPSSNTTPIFSGTAEANSNVKVSEGATLLCTAAASASGIFSCTSAALTGAPQTHNATATATDAALNTSAVSNLDTFVIDTRVPAAPTLSALPPNSSNTQPGFSGTGAAGDTVTVSESSPAAATLCTALVAAGGTWSCTSAVVLSGSPATTYKVAATQTTPAGAISPATATQTFVEDTHTPATPTLAGPASPSNVNTPVLSGTGEAGDTMVVKDQTGRVVCSVTVLAGGTWSCTGVALPDGAATLTATSTTPAGVSSAPSTSANLTVDTLAPGAPSLAQTASPTSSTLPTFTGTAEANSTVKVSEGATLLCTVAATGSGTFSCTSTVALASPVSHSVTATATDAATNTSAQSNVDTFTVDTRVPAAPVVNALPTPSGGQAGFSASTQPTFTGSGVVGEVVTLKASAPAAFAGQTLCTATVASDGSWSCASGVVLTGAPATSFTVAATQASPAGVASPASGNLSFTVDTHTPPTPTVVAPASPTNNNTPTLTGTAEAGDTLAVKDQTGRVVCSVTVPAGGSWSCTTLALPDGSSTFTAVSTTRAGVASATSAAASLTIDTLTPAAPVLAQTSSPTGNATPTFGGTAEANSTVKVSEGATLLCTTAASASGVFSCTSTVTLTSGLSHTAKATATDAALNTSAPSNADTFTVDTSVPAPPVLAALPTPPNGQAGFTSSTQPTLSGTGVAFDTVTVKSSAPSAATLCKALVASDGTWSCLAAPPLATAKSYTIAATQTDPAGVTSAATANQTFTVDTHTPATPTLVVPASPTSNNKPALSGTGEVGSNVLVKSQTGALLCSAIVAPGGSWNCTSTVALPDGAGTLTATAFSPAGVASSAASQPLTVDTVAPTAPVIGQTATPTGSATPTFSGSAEPSATVRVSEGATLLCTTAALANGSFSCTSGVTLTSNGNTHNVTAVATDDAGNASPISNIDTFVVDSRLPAAPVIAAQPGFTANTQPTFSGTGIPGETLNVLETSPAAQTLCTTIVHADSTWTCQSTVALTGSPATSYTIAATQTDSANVTSPPSATQTFTVDTHTPVKPTLAQPATPTNNKTPALSGTAEALDSLIVKDQTGATICTVASVPASGNWSCAASALPDGTSTLTATSTSRAGIASPASTPVSVTVITVTPATPSLNPTPSPTANTLPAFSGSAPPNSTVKLVEGATALCSVVAAADGSYSCTSTVALTGAPQQHSVTATSTDSASNVSAPSIADVFTVDTRTPAAPTLAALAATTAAAQPTFSGTGTAGDTVAVKESVPSAQTLCTAIVSASGTWTCASAVVLPGSPATSYTVAATQTSPAGVSSPSTASQTFVEDAHTPAAPSIAAVASPTNNPAPALSGSGETGDTLVVKDQTGRVLCTVVVPAGGSWSCTSASLPDGTATLTATQTTSAGLASPGSSSVSVLVDTLPPAAPSLAQTASPTSSTKPLFAGNAEPNSALKVSEGATTLCATVASASGAFSCSPTTALGAGSHTVVAIATDAANNSSAASNSDVFSVDTSAPAAPGLDALPTAANGMSGFTSSPQPLFTGTGVPGDPIIVKASAPAAAAGQTLCTTTVLANGTWSCADAVLLTGAPATSYTAAATQTSPSGLVSPASSSRSFTVDTHVPIAPTVSAFAGPGNNPTPQLTGTGDVGDVLIVRDQTGRALCTTTVAAGGTWTCTSATLPDGTATLTATSYSDAGVASPPSAGTALTVDTVAPLAPALAQTSSPTANPRPVFSGAAEPGAMVQVSEGATLLCTATAALNGSFSCPSTVSLDGAPQTHNVTATATDAAGNVGPASPADTFVEDTRVPSTPTLSALPKATATTQPGFSGTGTPGDSIALTASAPAAQPLCSATVLPDGTWSCSTSVLLTGAPPTSYTVAATQTSAAGVPSGASAAQSFVVDTHTPAVPTLAQPATPTNNNQPGLSGTGEANAAITVRDQTGRAVCATVVSSGGAWSCTSVALPDGQSTLTATQTTAAGIVSPASAPVAVLVDTIAPAQPSIAQTPSPTSNTHPTFAGSAEPGSLVTASEGATVLCTATASSSGAWSCNSLVALPGAPQQHTVAAIATDAAGNASVASAPDTLTVDTSTPAAPVLAALPTAPGGQPGFTAATQPGFSGTGTPGDLVQVSATAPSARALCSAVVQADGTWQCQSAQLTGVPATSYTVAAVQVNAAGSPSPLSAPQSFTVDTHQPAVPTLVQPASPTAQNTPGLSGTGESGATLWVLDQTGRVLCAVIVASAGSWSCTSALLPDGTTALVAVQTSAAGVASPISPQASLVVDTLKPAPPVLSQNASPSDLTTPAFSGSAEPNSTVTVSEGAAVLCTTMAGSNGIFSCPSTVALAGPLQTHLATATAQDAAGNVSAPSNGDSFVIDTRVPASPTLAALPTPTGGQPGFTASTQPTFTGTGAPGDTVAVATSAPTAQTLCLALVQADGSWSCASTVALTGQPATSYTAAATETSPSGVTSPATAPETFTVDTHTPSVPTLDAPASPTNVRKALLSGTGDVGSAITVVDQTGRVVCVSTVQPDGTWSCTSAALPDGTSSLTVTATTSAGVVSAASAPGTVTVDTVAPMAPVLAQTSSPTSNTLPVFSGTGEPGSTVTVSNASTVLCTALVQTSGVFSCGSLVALPGAPQQYTVNARSNDAAGNLSPLSNGDTFVVDTTTPAAPVLAALPTPKGGQPGYTANTQPVFSGTGAPGEPLTVYATAPTAQPLCSTFVLPDGTWSCASTVILAGTPPTGYTVDAVETSAAGVPSPASSTQTFTVDTHTPAAPVIAQPTSPTSNKTPMLSGTAEAGSSLVVTDQAGRTLCALTVPGGGAWTCTSAAMPDGLETLTAVATSPAGAVSPNSAPVQVAIDTHVPAAPVLAQTASPSSNFTPVFTGTSEPFAVVTLRSGATVLCLAHADSAGVFACLSSAITGAPQQYTVIATATDAAGTAGQPSNADVFTLDTTVPATPVLAALAVPAGGAPGFTSNTQPVLSGTGTPGDTIVVAASAPSAQTLCMALVAANGSWSCTSAQLIGAPATGYTASATQTSPAGVASPASGPQSFTIDTHTPAAPALAQPASPTNNKTPPLAGTAEAGDSLVVTSQSGAVVCTVAVVPPSGRWTCNGSALSDGTTTLTATSTSPAGTASSPSAPVSVVVDSVAPVAPVLAQTPSPASNPMPRFTGSAEPGALVSVSEGGQLLCTATASSTGLFSCSSTLALTGAPQQHTVTATATDAAGNQSAQSNPDVFVEDSRGASVTLDAPASPSPNTQPTLTGTGTPGDTVVVSATAPTAGPLCTATVRADGTWSCQSAVVLTGLPATAYTAQATETTPAGVSTQSATVQFTVDVHAPAPPTLDQPATPTSNRKPSLTGTGEPGDVVTVLDAYGRSICTATVASSGAWTCTPEAPLADGDYALTATQMSPAGVASGVSPIRTLSIRTLSAPTLDPIASPTRNGSPTLTGSGQPGQTVTVYSGETPLCTASVSAAGTWSCVPMPSLPDGSYLLDAQESDGLGHTSGVSGTQPLVVDNLPPAAPVLAQPVSPTSDVAPVLSGTAEAGSQVTVRDATGAVICTATARASGSFSCTPSAPLADGTHTFKATATDASGNVSVASAPVSLLEQHSGITPPVIVSPGAGAEIEDQGTAITGTSQPGTVVEITLDGVTYTAQVAADGSWSFLPPNGLAPGPHTVSAVDRNSAGTRSASVSSDFTVSQSGTARGGCSSGGLPVPAVLVLLALLLPRRKRSLVVARGPARRKPGTRAFARSTPSTRSTRIFAVVVSLCALPALADAPSIDVATFRPASGGDGYTGVEGARPPVTGETPLELRLWGDEAVHPLVFRLNSGGQEILVRSRTGAWLSVQAHLLGPLSLSAQLPITLAQSGDLSSLPPSARGPSTLSSGLSDLRLTPRLALMRQSWAGVDLSAQVSLELPTARAQSLSGDGRLQGEGLVALGHRFYGSGLPFLEILGNAWLRLRPPHQILDVKTGNQAGLRLALAYYLVRPQKWLPTRIYGEAEGNGFFRGGFSPGTAPAEWRVGGSFCLGKNLAIDAAGGGALSNGIGAPVARFVVGIGYSPSTCTPSDRDGDGIADLIDQCPGAAGDAAHRGCPLPPDRDGDGVADADDLCPEVPGPASNQGCPLPPEPPKPVAVVAIAAPPPEPAPLLVAAPPPVAPPPDRDGDGVPDAEDSCPDQPGPVENHGCPKTVKQLVVITAGKLVILDKVYFATGKAVIEKRSFKLLDQVAEVIAAHAELTLIQIEGHTDDQGNTQKNTALSQARAEAVRTYLVGKKIEATRLKAVGFGPLFPVALNKSKAGREQNRRVEFKVLETASHTVEVEKPAGS